MQRKCYGFVGKYKAKPKGNAIVFRKYNAKHKVNVKDLQEYSMHNTKDW